jgi:hypothetical protein
MPSKRGATRASLSTNAKLLESAPFLCSNFGWRVHTPKAGQRWTNPMVYRREGDQLFAFASTGGKPTTPDSYHNLLANPVATVEVGAERFQVRASSTAEPERRPSPNAASCTPRWSR